MVGRLIPVFSFWGGDAIFSGAFAVSYREVSFFFQQKSILIDLAGNQTPPIGRNVVLFSMSWNPKQPV